MLTFAGVGDGALWFAKRLVNAFRLQIRQKETSITNDEDVGIGKLLVSKRTQLKWRKIQIMYKCWFDIPCFCCRNCMQIGRVILLDPTNCESRSLYGHISGQVPLSDMTSRHIEQMMAPSWIDLCKVIDGCLIGTFPSQEVKSLMSLNLGNKRWGSLLYTFVPPTFIPQIINCIHFIPQRCS